MTRKNLIFNVVAVMSAFATLILLAFAAKSLKLTSSYEFLKDFSALFIAIGAAYLAYCFQQRQAFLFSLRELWTEIVKAKTRVNFYVKHKHPSENDFHRAYRSLSKAIDLVRGVYLNVKEDEKSIGLYPYEPLHDIRKILEQMGFQEIDARSKLELVERMDDAWNALRYKFLLEFERPQASHPITRRYMRDPRRRPP